jgi:hypothetical protein
LYLLWLYICIIQRMSYKKQELDLREHLNSLPVYGGVCVAHLFIFLCCFVCLHVWYTQCCQFLWIVHSWLSFRFSLTFIYSFHRVFFQVICLFLSVYFQDFYDINWLMILFHLELIEKKLTGFQIAYFSDLTTVYEFIQVFCIH